MQKNGLDTKKIMALFLKNNYSYTVANAKEEINAYESINKVADNLRADGKEVHIAVDKLIEEDNTTLIISLFEGVDQEEEVNIGLTF